MQCATHLVIESEAKRRLADEYDAAQGRGSKVGPADIGLSHKQVHEARVIRDAEKADPGIVRRTLNEHLPTWTDASRKAERAQPVTPEIRSEPRPYATKHGTPSARACAQGSAHIGQGRA